MSWRCCFWNLLLSWVWTLLFKARLIHRVWVTGVFNWRIRSGRRLCSSTWWWTLTAWVSSRFVGISVIVNRILVLLESTTHSTARSATKRSTTRPTATSWSRTTSIIVVAMSLIWRIGWASLSFLLIGLLLRSIEIGWFICDSNVFQHVGQAINFIFIVCKQSVFSVYLHFTRREQFRFLDLSATKLHVVCWLGLTHLSLQVVVIQLGSYTTALSLSNLLLRLSWRLFNRRSVLLCDFALHHVDTAAF